MILEDFYKNEMEKIQMKFLPQMLKGALIYELTETPYFNHPAVSWGEKIAWLEEELRKAVIIDEN